MNHVECPFEGTGVWNNRLRPRVKKEPTVRALRVRVRDCLSNTNIKTLVKCPNVKKESIIIDLKRKVKRICKDPGNNNMGEERDKKKSDVTRTSPGNVSLKSQPENNSKVGSKLKLMNPKPKTIKERMQNREVLKALNENHEDDFFEDNEVLKTARCSLLESSSLSSSESFSFSSPGTESLSPLRELRREDTPEWYTSWVEETSLNLDCASTFQHNAFIHKQLKQRKGSVRLSANEVVGQVASFSRMKDLIVSSSNKIAVLSSGLACQKEDDEEQCEEYFSEDD